MKQVVYKIAYSVVVTGLLVACKPDQKVPTASKGNIDPTKYVAIGNSITSGYADAALYYDGQMVSYPNLIAQQLKEVGGGEFKQPLFPAGSVGAGASGLSVNSKLVLGYKTDCKGVSALSPIPASAYGDGNALFTSIAAQGPFNNMGVPGAKSFHVPFAGYGKLNPFFGRMTSDPVNKSILADAMAQQATFFTVFIGNNDVLSYALAGGASDSITNQLVFSASIDGILAGMTANGAKGAVGSIPDVTNIPYFTTVPYNGLTLDANSAAALSAAYKPLGISFTAGANAFIIQDASVPGGFRKIKSNELILLSTPQDSLKCGGWGSMKPIPDKFVLTETEISKIQTAVAGYNAKLKSVAAAKGLAYADVNAFMATAKKGIAYNGITINATFVSGGAFSLDGVHLTPRGNALLANEFIKAINSTYGSGIRLVDVSKYNGVVFP